MLKASVKKFFPVIPTLIAVMVILVGTGFFVAKQQSGISQKQLEVVLPTPTPQEDQKITFDPIRFNPPMEAFNKLDQLKPIAEKIEPFRIIYEVTESGQIFRLVLPLDPTTQSQAIIDGELRGYKVDTNEYAISLFHLLNVPDAARGCSNYLEKFESDFNYGKAPAPSTVRKPIEIENGLGVFLQSPKVTYTVGCFFDVKNKGAWIVETFFETDIYNKKYQKISPLFLRNFAFSD